MWARSSFDNKTRRKALVFAADAVVYGESSFSLE